MAISPQTEVHLLCVPFDKTYKNQICFGSESEQTSYFQSKTVHSFNSFTYQRAERAIKVGKNLDELWNVNYVMYQNDGKWFYAFITEMKYINNGTSLVFIETDVYQTWLFNVTLLESFIVREHVTSDNIGEHLLDEGLDTGDYVYKSNIRNTDMDDLWIIVGLISDATGELFGGMYGNVYSGIKYLAFDSYNAGIIAEYINALPNKGASVAMVFSIPKLFLPSGVSSGVYVPSGSIPHGTTVNIPIDKTSIDGYVPKNNKMFSYPYTLMHVSNNKGATADFRIEDFSNTDMLSFDIKGNVAPNPTALCIPRNYKGVVQNWTHSLSLDGFPLGSWNNDIYAQWLSRNAPAIALNAVGSISAIAGGVLTANPLAIGGGVMGVMSQLSSLYQHSTEPNQAKGNTNNGSVNCALGVQSFFFSQMEIKAEYAQRIDKFFDMYGYKVNTVKIPNVNTRPYWNFIQTIDVNIKGNIPADDMTKLKSLYNQGITLWKSGENIGNYSLNNH